MKKLVLQLLTLAQIFNFGILHSQGGQNSNMTGVWSASGLPGLRPGQDVCHQYALSLADNGSGYLTMALYFFSDDDRYSIGYTGVVPFTYTILETDTTAKKTIAMEISYEVARFMFQEMPKYDPNTIPPDHLSYVEEIKQYITNRKEEYRIILEENAGLTIEGFTLNNGGNYIYFRENPLSEPCDAMRRN